MMIGIGMPRSQSRIERIVVLLVVRLVQRAGQT
jgi:hypothetical protein